MVCIIIHRESTEDCRYGCEDGCLGQPNSQNVAVWLVGVGLARGGMLTAILVLFVLMGSFAGYWSATMYKFFNGKKWKRSTLVTALLFPSVVFAIYWALDLMVGTLSTRSCKSC